MITSKPMPTGNPRLDAGRQEEHDQITMLLARVDKALEELRAINAEPACPHGLSNDASAACFKLSYWPLILKKQLIRLEINQS